MDNITIAFQPFLHSIQVDRYHQGVVSIHFFMKASDSDDDTHEKKDKAKIGAFRKKIEDWLFNEP